MSSSTTRARPRPQCATRTGRCITRWRKAGRTGWFIPLVNYHWTFVANIKRDPFEQTVGFGQTKSAAAIGRSTGRPKTTAYLYDWNMLPIGQLLWEKELMSYKEFPPLQAAGNLQPLGEILKTNARANKGDD